MTFKTSKWKSFEWHFEIFCCDRGIYTSRLWRAFFEHHRELFLLDTSNILPSSRKSWFRWKNQNDFSMNRWNISQRDIARCFLYRKQGGHQSKKMDRLFFLSDSLDIHGELSCCFTEWGSIDDIVFFDTKINRIVAIRMSHQVFRSKTALS